MTHDVLCAVEKLVIAELSEHVNTTLYTVTSIHHKARDFYSKLSVFFIVQTYASLIHGNQYSQNPKKDKKATNSETRWRLTEDPRFRRSLFQTSYTMLSMFYTKSICIKNYIYIMGGPRVILEM